MSNAQNNLVLFANERHFKYSIKSLNLILVYIIWGVIMENNDVLNYVIKGLSGIDGQLKQRINTYNETNINMKENLDSLLMSMTEIDEYIDILKKDIKDEDNIFFLGVASQEKQHDLENHEKSKSDLNEHITNLKETIKKEDSKRKFLEEISANIEEYNDMIKSLINEKNSRETSILENLKKCQKLSKIDRERCYIEIGKIIEEVEKWEKN